MEWVGARVIDRSVGEKGEKGEYGEKGEVRVRLVVE
jgi:hypothetical protein